jgi:hypothetical protein
MTKKEAVRIVEGTIGGHPEIRAIERKEHIIEGKHTPTTGHQYCQYCDTWSPEEPAEIKALYKEWDKIFAREVKRIWKTESAT